MYKSLVHIQFSRTRNRWSSHFGVLHFLLHALIDLWDPKTPQKYEKSSKIDCFLVVMVTDFIYYFIFLFILIGLGSPIILVYYTTFYMHSLIRETQRTLKNGEKWLLCLPWLPWLPLSPWQPNWYFLNGWRW